MLDKCKVSSWYERPNYFSHSLSHPHVYVIFSIPFFPSFISWKQVDPSTRIVPTLRMWQQSIYYSTILYLLEIQIPTFAHIYLRNLPSPQTLCASLLHHLTHVLGHHLLSLSLSLSHLHTNPHTWLIRYSLNKTATIHLQPRTHALNSSQTLICSQTHLKPDDSDSVPLSLSHKKLFHLFTSPHKRNTKPRSVPPANSAFVCAFYSCFQNP